jgi:hypothetical protein
VIVVTVARKPLFEGSVAANVLAHGVGAMNVDGTRIACVGEENPSIATREAAVRRGRAPITGRSASEANEEGRILRRGSHEAYLAEHRGERLGRWPANLVLQHLDGCIRKDTEGCILGCPVLSLDESSGILHSQDPATRKGRPGVHGTGHGTTYLPVKETAEHYADTGGANRFFKQVGGRR